MLVYEMNLRNLWVKNLAISELMKLDYEKDSLEHLSDNDELFVSNRNDVKAAPNYLYLG